MSFPAGHLKSVGALLCVCVCVCGRGAGGRTGAGVLNHLIGQCSTTENCLAQHACSSWELCKLVCLKKLFLC